MAEVVETISRCVGCLSDSTTCCSCAKKAQTRVAFTLVAAIVATVDVATDWVNYVTFSRQQFAIEITYVVPLMAITIVSTVLYAAEIGVLLGRLCRMNERALDSIEHVLTYMLWIFEDMTVMGIQTFAFLNGSCPLVSQFRSLPGRLALVAGAFCVLLRMILAGLFYDKWSRATEEDMKIKKEDADILQDALKKCPGRDDVRQRISKRLALSAKKRRRCVSGLQILVLVVMAGTMVVVAWSLYLAFKPLFEKDNGIFVTHTVTTSYIVRRRNDGQPTRTITSGDYSDVLCRNLTNTFFLGTMEQLREENDVSRQVPCGQIPAYTEFLEAGHLQYVTIDEEYSCLMIFTIQYNNNNTFVLRRSIHYELRPPGANTTCVSGHVNITKMATLPNPWSPEVAKGIWDQECGGSKCSDVKIGGPGTVPYIHCNAFQNNSCSVVSDIQPETNNQLGSVATWSFGIDKKTFPCYYDIKNIEGDDCIGVLEDEQDDRDIYAQCAHPTPFRPS